MITRKVHYISGLTITIFTGLHLFNHLCSIFGADKHIEIMNVLRHFYRNMFIEAILLSAVLIQVVSGLKLFKLNRNIATSNFEKLHIWTGLYLAIFFLIHVSTVLGARYLLHLDTNFYFGVAGLNSFPFNMFFIPYYGLAIISFFGHIASIHNKRMKSNFLNVIPEYQARAIIIFGFILTVFIFLGLTDYFQGVQIPDRYKILGRK